MDNSIIETIEKLYDKAETYGKTTVKLGKHLVVYSTADVISDLAVKVVVSSLIGLCLLFANIGLSLYVGEILGHQYLGFLTVAGFYLLIALILYIFREMCIKNPVSNFVISTMKKDILS